MPQHFVDQYLQIGVARPMIDNRCADAIAAANRRIGWRHDAPFMQADQQCLVHGIELRLRQTGSTAKLCPFPQLFV